ncbi:MAG: fused uroporphyrinogen-III synthase HemD/membrane protein HemX [Burkholderiales bacterium]|nr:fused uroporphyrinogen-III synthase HemD/membrane protein HemX [Burkholderiales bacterium]
MLPATCLLPDPGSALLVIVTRPRDQAGTWLDELQALGWPARSLPLIEIGPPTDVGPLRQAWARLGDYALVMFVSANAVRGLFDAAATASTPEPPAWPSTARAASTGPGTTAALRAAGVAAGRIVEPAADAASFDSEALWQRLQGEDWSGRRVLVVRGDGGREWLAERLRERGATVDFVAAYRRLAPQPDAAGRALLAQALAQPRDAVWLFSSSEALGHLRTLAPQAGWSGARAIATHPRIAEAARQFGFGVVESAAPAPNAVAAVLARMAADTIGAPVTETPQTPSAAPAEPRVAPAATATPSRWTFALALLFTLLLAAALMLAWNTQQRVKTLEAELVKRQQDSGVQATEARTLAQQAETAARESAAKMTLLEARVDETSIQRSQLEDLIQSLSRSRDENVLADIDTSVRVAMRQAAITGSAEPLLSTLKQADDRLARYNQPRLERVRRAVVQDMDRVRGAGVTDINGLTIRLDEVIRQIDELPLQSNPERRARPAAAPAAAKAASAPGSAAAAGWREWIQHDWQGLLDRVWQEVRGLVRVTRIDHPDAMLIAPDQVYFLRENLKLRLLNARLALLSRQFDTAQSDLRAAQAALERYFDHDSRRVTAAIELLRQAQAQARQVNVPQPDATLAALAAASAGR